MLIENGNKINKKFRNLSKSLDYSSYFQNLQDTITMYGLKTVDNFEKIDKIKNLLFDMNLVKLKNKLIEQNETTKSILSFLQNVDYSQKLEILQNTVIDQGLEIHKIKRLLKNILQISNSEKLEKKITEHSKKIDNILDFIKNHKCSSDSQKIIVVNLGDSNIPNPLFPIQEKPKNVDEHVKESNHSIKAIFTRYIK